ncbi:MAG: 50S ribosomal protein L19e [Gammaproteobacteria bacterium]|jgi:large subunit ribosomal protein L19e|nr:50S ribosomal protein L19e [Gammaproteobacteria bacterium]
MTNLSSQRRLAAQIMKIGQNRVWIDPERVDDVDVAITREEIRKLIHEKIIASLPEKGVSRSRAKTIIEKKRKGRRKGSGSKTGSPRAKITKKEAWMIRIRSLRKRLRELKTSRIITVSTYRKIYMVAGSGKFDSIADLERYLKTNDLWRNR